MTRKQEREEVFKTLYAREVKGDYSPETDSDFVWQLVDGVKSCRQELDEKLNEQLQDWRMERVYPVERVLLRIGLYELLYTSTAKAVVINEAVDLAKKYGDSSTSSFVNGILDNFDKEAGDKEKK
ncbi:MAG: transcription antitermination factor NusB [bacterium]